MRYYITQEVYKVNIDGTTELREKTSGVVTDNQNIALSNAEAKFYARIANDLEAAAMFGNNLLEQDNMLHIEDWFLDKEHQMPVLHLEITEHQLMHNLSAGTDNSLPECDIELQSAVLLGEALVTSQYADVVMTRERLYRTNEGVFLLECSRKFGPTTIKWDSEKRILTYTDAEKWGRTYLNRILYDKIFGVIPDNTDVVPTAFVLERKTLQQLQRFAATTGHNPSTIVQNALNAYLS